MRYHSSIRGGVRSRDFLTTCNFKLHGALSTPSEMQNWGECQGEKISGGPRHTPNTLAVQAMGPHRSKVSSTTLDPIKWGPRLGSKYNSTWRAPALPRIGLRFEGADHLMTPVRGNSAGGVHQGPLTSEVNSRCMSDVRGLSDASRAVASAALSYHIHIYHQASQLHTQTTTRRSQS